MQDLGTFGGGSSQAFGINDRGQIVGEFLTADDNQDAFLYSRGLVQDLGSLLGGSTFALGINNRGEVVGHSTDPFNISTRAFLYSDGQMHNLNSLIPPDSGWTLVVATGIDDAGQIVRLWHHRRRDTLFLY